MWPLLIAAGSALLSYNQNKKAASAAKDAAAASQVDINALDAKTREIAQRNAIESAELERLLTPEVPELRKKSIEGVTQSLGDSAETQAASSALMGSLGGKAVSPLLQAAIEKARAELGMGGQLDVDTRNEVMRTGLARAGAVGGGLGLGRDVVARDLGLKSLALNQQRLENASRLGGQELEGEQFNATNLLNQIQMLRAIGDGRFGRNLAAAQFGQSIEQPIVGLDPSSIANATVGNANNAGAALSNKANIYGQQSQNLMNFAGNAAGYGLLQYNKAKGGDVNSTMKL